MTCKSVAGYSAVKPLFLPFPLQSLCTSSSPPSSQKNKQTNKNKNKQHQQQQQNNQNKSDTISVSSLTQRQTNTYSIQFILTVGVAIGFVPSIHTISEI